jgi:magnesium-transporting ATPase (P-type)
MILLFSVITDGALFALFAWLISNGSAVDYARTMAFGGIGITALLYVFSVRVLDRPVWKANPFSNPALVFAVAAGFILYGVALYVPRVAELLQTVPLNGNDWFLLLTLGLFNVAMFEFVKRLFLNGRQRLKAQYAGEYGGA